jgi:hypothetical protein
MTTEDFRRFALSYPDTLESSHMGHPDFRTHGKIFATLHYPNEKWGMVKLPPEYQHNFAQAQPDVFVPVKGAWGRHGATNVLLEAVDAVALERAIEVAWKNAASVRRKSIRTKK